MTAISAILHIIHIIPRLLTQQPLRLSARHVEVLSTSDFVALHTRANFRLLFLSLFFTYGTDSAIPFRRNQLQNYWLHSVVITESHFRNIQRTNNVSPMAVVSGLQCAVSGGTQLAPLQPFNSTSNINIQMCSHLINKFRFKHFHNFCN